MVSLQMWLLHWCNTCASPIIRQRLIIIWSNVLMKKILLFLRAGLKAKWVHFLRKVDPRVNCICTKIILGCSSYSSFHHGIPIGLDLNQPFFLWILLIQSINGLCQLIEWCLACPNEPNSAQFSKTLCALSTLHRSNLSGKNSIEQQNLILRTKTRWIRRWLVFF